MAKKKVLSDFQQGIFLCIGLLHQHHSTQAAEFLLKETGEGKWSLDELVKAGLEDYDIENLKGLLPQSPEKKPSKRGLKIFTEIGKDETVLHK